MGNVVQISPFLTDRRFADLDEIDAYWHALKGTRAMPSRAAVNPGEIDGALQRAFILQRIAPGRTRLRLAGSDLRDLMGMELRGMPLTAFFVPQARDRVEILCADVCTLPGLADLRLQAEVGPGTPAFDARMKLWPLADDQGRPTRILGVFSFQAGIGTAPRRFRITASRLHRIDRDGSSIGKRPTTAGRDRPYLKLVKTGE